MATKQNTDLSERDIGYMALANSDLGAMMAEELDGLDAGFERVKVPSGGGLMFEMPGEEGGDPEAVKEFSAVILHHHPLHVYYATKYTGGNQPPDCASFDGLTGEGEPGGPCRKCPLNQFGSGENGAKACKNRRRIYVLREGEIFPLLLSLPTGSLQEFTRYIKRLLSKGRKSNAVVTRFTLRKATNAGGVVYTHAMCIVLRGLTYADEAEYFRTQNLNVRPLTKYNLFKAGLEAGDKVCVHIDEICRANGYMVSMSSRGFNNISAIYALITVCAVYGYSTLDDTLKLIRATWEGVSNATRREFLVGVAEFVHRFGPVDFAQRMRYKNIAAIWQDYLAETSHSNRQTCDPAMRKAFCRVLVRHYNKGLAANSRKRLEMEG